MSAAVVRVKDTPRGLAISVDGNGRFCYLDPYQGARLAVAEASRNVACAGGEPIGATNNLNFGNPERPEIMWQIGEAVRGIGDACRALDTPITGGNVSLYNETEGRAIFPTPVLGVVGLLEDASKTATRTFKTIGAAVVLLGDNLGELGGSEYLATMHNTVAGKPPVLDLKREAALQKLIVKLIRDGCIESAHDCSEGGLAIALAECTFDSGGIGVSADRDRRSASDDANAVDVCRSTRRCSANRRRASCVSVREPASRSRDGGGQGGGSDGAGDRPGRRRSHSIERQRPGGDRQPGGRRRTRMGDGDRKQDAAKAEAAS